MPTLSICIPSYNRAQLLVQALTAIVDQLTENTRQQVEIIVSDNASPDETPLVVADFIARHSEAQLVYVRQSNNLGSEGNINFLLTRAVGDFVYLVSDDDVLLPGAIDAIFKVLDEQPTIDAISLNTVSFLTTPDEASAPILDRTQDGLFYNRDEALVALGTWLTFVSALVFRRECLSAAGYADRIGNNFIQGYVFLDVLKHQRGCWFTQQPFLAIRGNNTGGYNFFQVFVSDFAALLDHAVQLGFSSRAARQVLIDHEKFIVGFIIAFKVRGTYGALRPDFGDGLKRLYRIYRFDPVFLIKVTPLMLVPPALVQIARKLRRWKRRGA